MTRGKLRKTTKGKAEFNIDRKQTELAGATAGLIRLTSELANGKLTGVPDLSRTEEETQNSQEYG